MFYLLNKSCLTELLFEYQYLSQDVINNHARVSFNVTVSFRASRVIRFEIEIAFEKEIATTVSACSSLPTPGRDDQRANKRRSASGDG